MNAAAPGARTWSHFKCEQSAAARGAIPAPPFPAPPFWGAASTRTASPEQTLHVSRLKPQPRARRQLLGQNLRRVGFTLASSCWPANTGDVPVLLPSMRCSARPCRDFKSEQAPAGLQGT